MLPRFLKYVSEEGLFQPQHKILLAVSGGVDSMVLLNLFHESGFEFGVVHCNFQLRGKESDSDELFVADYIKRHGIEFYTKSFDTEAYAKLESISIEMAARQLRYEYFEEIRQQNGFNFIATAHHQDDVIETFFINLVRKTGIKGLTGIKPKSGNLVRPLLFANRKEILDYAFDKEIVFREDSSNNTTIFRRNFIRHNILPQFDELLLAARENIIASIGHLKEVEEVFLETIESEKQDVIAIKGEVIEVNIENLLQSKFPKILLFEILYEYQFNSAVINEVHDSLKEQPGKKFYSAGYRVVKDREILIVSKKEEYIGRNTYINKDDQKINEPIRLKFELFEAEGYKIPKSDIIACLDFDKLDFPLIIKKWQQGEYFQPLGMSGFKKLSDFFIDKKLSIPEKENTHILYSGDKVAWIIGKRIDNRFRVTPETKRIYRITLDTKKNVRST